MVTEIILITVLSFIANCIGTVSGFGVGTIMTPLLLLFLPFGQTILLVCIIHWFHDIFKLFFFRHGFDRKLFLYFGIPTVFATALGAMLVTPTQSMVLTSLLGLFLIASVAMMYAVTSFKIPNNWVTGTIGGLLSGFFAGIFGIRGAVRSVFMAAFDLNKAAFIGTTGAISLLLDSTRLGVYLWDGIRITQPLFLGLALFIPASFFGAYCGSLVVHRIPQTHFRGVVSFFLLIVGIKLLLTPWLGW
jgi:uncharacterized protein